MQPKSTHKKKHLTTTNLNGSVKYMCKLTALHCIYRFNRKCYLLAKCTPRNPTGPESISVYSIPQALLKGSYYTLLQSLDVVLGVY